MLWNLGQNIFSIIFKFPIHVLIWNDIHQEFNSYFWISISCFLFLSAKTNGCVCGCLGVHSLWNLISTQFWFLTLLIPMMLTVQNILAHLIFLFFTVSPLTSCAYWLLNTLVNSQKSGIMPYASTSPLMPHN